MPTPRSVSRALLLSASLAALSLTTPAAAADVALGTYVVTYAAPPTETDVDVLRGAATTVRAFRHLPAAVVTAPVTRLALLRNLPGVRGVWGNEAYALLDQKANVSIRADRAWGPYTGGLGWTGTGWTGEGIGIGVIDAGVDGTHPDLCALPEFCRGTPVKTVRNVKFAGATDHAEPYVAVDVVSSDNSSGHGTHVAGIAAGFGTASEQPGIYQGVAPGAHVVGMGAGEAIEVANVLAGFDFAIANAAAHNIKVLNNSWGPGYGTPYDPDHPVNRAIDAATAAGISVVFGAGNDGPKTDSLNAFSVNPNAISVAATNKWSEHVAFFSSRGVPGSPLWHPTVAAPGEHIVGPRSLAGTTTHAGDATSANPEPISDADTPYYGNVSGTSMAAPHVAGVVALMQQAAYETRGTYLTPAQVKAILQGTARTSGTAAGLPNYQEYSMGAGLVDAEAATAAAAAGTGTAWDDGETYDVRAFRGTVGPAAFVQTSTFSTTYDVLPGAVSLDVMVDWKVAYANDVDITVYDPSGAERGRTFLVCGAAQPNGYSSFCSSSPNERLTFVAPAPGTWRVDVGGFVNTTENVRGLWSAAYPDGTPGLAPPTPAAALTLTAAAPASVQGRPVALTVTVTDAAGNVVPNASVTWSSAGAGRVVNAETWTASDGGAGANALSDAPGTQVVTASAGGLSASATVEWAGVVAPCLACTVSTPGKASGGGWFGAPKKHFAFAAEYVSGALLPGGQLTYSDGVRTVEADVVETFRSDGRTATFTGPATVDGAGTYRYRVTVTDNGEPGRNDTFAIEVTGVLSASGTLGGGNIQVR